MSYLTLFTKPRFFQDNFFAILIKTIQFKAIPKKSFLYYKI